MSDKTSVLGSDFFNSTRKFIPKLYDIIGIAIEKHNPDIKGKP